MKLIRYSNDVYQILNDEGFVAFMALRLANGKWGAYDRDDVRLTKEAFDSPSEVKAYLAGQVTNCAMDRDGTWCIVVGAPDESASNVATTCGSTIVLPHGLERRIATCPGCRSALSKEPGDG